MSTFFPQLNSSQGVEPKALKMKSRRRLLILALLLLIVAGAILTILLRPITPPPIILLPMPSSPPRPPAWRERLIQKIPGWAWRLKLAVMGPARAIDLEAIVLEFPTNSSVALSDLP